jgi:putative nucleotidyltransferase with HDIG domain
MVYLVRHGEPRFPGSRRLCIGRTDLPLSERGKRQACNLAAFFLDKNIKSVYHSCLLRAKETAELLANGEYPVIQADGLEEIDMGEWEGLTFGEIREKYPEMYERRGTDIMHITPPGAENFTDALSRFSRAVKRILNDDIVIVGHAGVNKVFLCETLGLNYSEIPEIPQPYGCVNILALKSGGIFVESYGRMPLDAPDDEECGYLLKQYKTPDNVIEHCRAVSRKAVQIAESLNPDCKIDRGLVKSAALLHDIARAEENHDRAGFDYLLKCGYPRIANIVLSHHKLEDLETVTESAIVFYADKLICGTEEVTLEERFSKTCEKCLTPEARASHKLQYDQARRARELIAEAHPPMQYIPAAGLSSEDAPYTFERE